MNTQPDTISSLATKSLVVIVAVVAGLQLFGDVLLGPNGLITRMLPSQAVLSASAFADANKYKLSSLVSDNFTRCQNKLGMQYTVIVDDIHNDPETELRDFERDLKLMYSAGMKYVYLTVNLFDAGQEVSLAETTIEVVNMVNHNHLVPIINLGPIRGTAFINNPDLTTNFIKRVADNMGLSSKFVVTAAPQYYLHERLENPSLDGNAILRQVQMHSDAVAAALTSYGNVIVSPPPLRTGEAAAMYAGFQFDLKLYDTMLFNHGNHDSNFKKGTSEVGKTAYGEYIASAKPWIEEFNAQNKSFMRIIVMGFGLGQDSYSQSDFPEVIIERLGYDYGRLADEVLIEGVIFDQSILRDAELSTNFYSRINQFGTNCNFDLVSYRTEYSDNSVAPVCAASSVTSASAGRAKTRYVCTTDPAKGGPTCEAVIEFTVQVGLPIRSFCSTNAAGTSTKPFTPSSVRTSTLVSQGQDLLNQFAGELTASDSTYMMPCLGSAINAVYPGLNYINFAPQTEWQMSSEFSAGSYLIYSNIDRSYKVNAYGGAWAFDENATAMTPKNKLSEEEIVCAGKDLCVSAKQIPVVTGLGYYDPLRHARKHEAVNQCGGAVASVDRDPQNMVYGGELIVKKEESRMHPNVLAKRVARGEIESSKVRYRANYTSNTSTCPCLTSGGAVLPFTNANFRSGRCNVPDSNVIANRCFEYLGGLDTYAQSDAYFEASFPTMPQYDIDGAYDALASIYNQVQTYASNKGEKFVFRQGWGWEGDVSMKAYSAVPDFDTEYVIKEPRTSPMAVNNIHRGAPRVAGATTDSSAGSSCTVGINLAMRVEGVTQDITGKAAELGYSHGLVITTGGGAQRQPTINALNNLCSQGITPVLRSCFANDCNFSGGTDQANFLNDVIESSSCTSVYAACGHNEPDAENARGFVHEGQWARDCASRLNSLGSSKVEVTTPTFNATHPDLNQHLGQFFQGYGTFNQSDYACLSFNTYANVGGTANASEFYTKITSRPEFNGMPVCIMETGDIAVNEGGQDTAVGAVIEDLSSVGGNNILFMLGFNWMGTNSDPRWAKFILSEDANSEAASCGGLSGGNFSIPGNYVKEFSNYLAEGNNRQSQKQYYEMLGFIDELNFIQEIMFSSTSAPDDFTAIYASWPRCESALVKAAENAGVKLNCIARATTDPRGTLYVEDPLGKFLCEKGYPVTGEDCSLFCRSTTPNPSIGTVSPQNVSCPLKRDQCFQGPLGNYTHYCAGYDPAFDFFGSGDETVYAPENGRIVFAEGNEDYVCSQKVGFALTEEKLIELNSTRSVGDPVAAVSYIRSLNGNFASLESSGAAIGFLGDSGIYYRMRHVDIPNVEAARMSSSQARFTGGTPLTDSAGRPIRLYHAPNDIYTPCWLGAHLHTWAKTGVDMASDPSAARTGQHVNAYQLYGEVLGCSSTESCRTPDRTCAPPNWVSVTDSGSGEVPLVCTPDSTDRGQLTGCNEFNCAPGNPETDTFTASLNCAANTIANDIKAGKSLGLTLDEYGPYCDNETLLPFVRCKLPGSTRYQNCTPEQAAQSGDYTSAMPFVANFLTVFNTYSPTQSTCTAPAAPRIEDIGKSCSSFPNKRDPNNPAWQYYRGGTENCIALSDLRWAPAANGRSVDVIVDGMVRDINYLGITLRDVPRDKIKAIVEAARVRDINPYILMGLWATESHFGKYRPQCNVY